MQFLFTHRIVIQAAFLCAFSTGIGGAASFTAATASCSTPSGNALQASTTPGVGVSATVPTCSAGAMADFGLLRGAATTSANDTSFGSYNSQFSIDYFLTNPNVGPNTPTTITIPLDYHVIIAAGAGGGSNQATIASFTMYLDSAVSPFWLINFQSTSDVFLPNICPSPSGPLSCNGEYFGTLAVTAPAIFNSTGPNRFWITMNGYSFNPATSNASNTVTIGASFLPAGVTVSYSDLSGNPLNLQTAPTGVPEPGTMALAGAALVVLAAKRRFR
jgi:hypothetical protein